MEDEVWVSYFTGKVLWPGGSGCRTIEEVRWLEPVPGQMMGKQREELGNGLPRCVSSRNVGAPGGVMQAGPSPSL